MKYIACLLLLLLSAGTSFAITCPAGLTCYLLEDWDTGDSAGDPPACWPVKTAATYWGEGGSVCATPFNGWYGRTWDPDHPGGRLSGLSSTIKHGASGRSLYIVREPGTGIYTAPYPGSAYKYFATDGNGPHKIHWRFYVYFPYNDTVGGAGLNQATHNTSSANDDQWHWLHLNGSAGSDSIYFDLMDMGNALPWGHCFQSGVEYFTVFMQTGNAVAFTADYCGFNVYDYADKWVALEFMFDIDNSKWAWWIDGVQVVGTGGNGVDQAFSGLTGFDSIWLDAFKSDPCLHPYIDNCIYMQHGSAYYVDDIIVADGYIGLEGETAVPNLTGVTIRGGSIQ